MKKEIEEYVDAIKQAYMADPFWSNNKREWSITWGRKMAKILQRSGGQTSVHCFVEIETGNIFKAATFKAPAKGIRGNIKNEKRPMFGSEFYYG